MFIVALSRTISKVEATNILQKVNEGTNSSKAIKWNIIPHFKINGLPSHKDESWRVVRWMKPIWAHLTYASYLCGFLKLLCSIMCWAGWTAPWWSKTQLAGIPTLYTLPTTRHQMPAASHQPPATCRWIQEESQGGGIRLQKCSRGYPSHRLCLGTTEVRRFQVCQVGVHIQAAPKPTVADRSLAMWWVKEIEPLTGTNEFTQRESAVYFHSPKFTRTILTRGQVGANGF